jgi:predicted site-specific integrase-resolvase
MNPISPTPQTCGIANAWVAPKTVALRLDVSVRTVRRWIERGDVQARKLSTKCVRVSWASVLAMMEAA